ncbi:hypothetical protein BDR26DRAFT_836714 [Obelidium mucronatum]|nr:hypothetical protein BDR26DRAFT_836714 [Obelidium mucronatum]
MDWLDPAMISMTADLLSDTPNTTPRDSIAVVKRCHADLLAAEAGIVAIGNNPVSKKRPKQQTPEALNLAVQNALEDLSSQLVFCDSMDLDDAFATFFELKTHLLIISLLKPTYPLDDAHILTSAVLRFFNVLAENIHSDHILFLLFSNNYINSLISHPAFSFRRCSPSAASEDGFNYFITLLKNLSNKLNKNSINFFLNENLDDFPLFTEALSLFESEEAMVRIAARTVTLNIFRVDDASAAEFLVNSVHAFDRLSHLWEREISTIQTEIATRNTTLLPKIETGIDDCVDTLLYFEEIFTLDIPFINSSLVSSLINGVLFKLVHDVSEKSDIIKGTTLFFLTQVFNYISYSPLLNSLTELIFSADHPTRSLLLSGLEMDTWSLISPELSLVIPADTCVSLCLALYASVLNSSHIGHETLTKCNICPVQRTNTRRLMDSLVSPSSSPQTESSMLATDSTTSLHSSQTGGHTVPPTYAYDENLVFLLIQILGSIHASKLRPVSLELAVWIIERLVGNSKKIIASGGDKEQRGSLNESQAAALLNANGKWGSMISALVNDGVDLVVDLLEYETDMMASANDTPQLLKDSRLLLPKKEAPVSKVSNVRNEIRDLAFLVRMWSLTSQCLDKLGYPKMHKLPDAVSALESPAELENDCIPCKFLQSKNPAIHGNIVVSKLDESLTILEQHNQVVTIVLPIVNVTCVVSETNTTALDISSRFSICR